MKRLAILIMACMTLIRLNASSGEDPYRNPIAQKALREALGLVQLYVPSSEFRLNDHAQEMNISTGLWIDESTIQTILTSQLSRGLTFEWSEFSEFLHEMVEDLGCPTTGYGYELYVSEPVDNIITCEAEPVPGNMDNKTKGFLFRYDKTTGDIIQMEIGELSIL